VFVDRIDAERKRFGERWETQRIFLDRDPFVRSAYQAALRMAETARPPETSEEIDAWYVNLSFLAHIELHGLCVPTSTAIANFPEPTYEDRMAMTEHVAVESGHLRFWRYMAEKLIGRDPVDEFTPRVLKGAEQFHKFLARDWLSYLVGLHICGEAYGMPVFEGLMTWKVCPPEMVRFTIEDWLPGEFQHQFTFTDILRRMLDDAPDDDARLELAAKIEEIELEGLYYSGQLGKWGDALRAVGVSWEGIGDRYTELRRHVYEDRLGVAAPEKPLPEEVLPGNRGMAPVPV
jgi:hypothetical protein